MEDSLASGRAATAFGVLRAQQYFYLPSRKLYREYHPFEPSTDQPIGYLWSFEEAARAALYLYGAPSGAHTYARVIDELLAAREEYWDGGRGRRGYRSYPFNGDRYYDDNSWTASNLLQQHLLTSHAGSVALDRARGVWSYIQRGWTRNLPNPGGVRWVDSRSNGDRATNSTAGWAKLGAQLYAVTGSSDYLDAAIQAYAWLRTYMLAANGLYANAMRADGRLDTKLWIYNQGIVIGAAVLLNRVTGDAQYLHDSVRLADATLAAFGGDAYYSGADGAYSGRAIFNAIFFRNLLMLYAVTGTAEYVERMRAYADTAWRDAGVHDAASGLFHLNGEPRYSLLDQAAMVQIYALLSWNPATYTLLT